MLTWFYDMVAAKSEKRTAQRIAIYARKVRIVAARNELHAQRKYGKHCSMRAAVRATRKLELVA